MAPLYAEFVISRKTGYKIFDPYKDCGVHGLTDRNRRGATGTPLSSAITPNASGLRISKASFGRNAESFLWKADLMKSPYSRGASAQALRLGDKATAAVGSTSIGRSRLRDA
jgi:hypothetical protein